MSVSTTESVASSMSYSPESGLAGYANDFETAARILGDERSSATIPTPQQWADMLGRKFSSEEAKLLRAIVRQSLDDVFASFSFQIDSRTGLCALLHSTEKNRDDAFRWFNAPVNSKGIMTFEIYCAISGFPLERGVAKVMESARPAMSIRNRLQRILGRINENTISLGTAREDILALSAAIPGDNVILSGIKPDIKKIDRFFRRLAEIVSTTPAESAESLPKTKQFDMGF